MLQKMELIMIKEEKLIHYTGRQTISGGTAMLLEEHLIVIFGRENLKKTEQIQYSKALKLDKTEVQNLKLMV